MIQNDCSCKLNKGYSNGYIGDGCLVCVGINCIQGENGDGNDVKIREYFHCIDEVILIHSHTKCSNVND